MGVYLFLFLLTLFLYYYRRNSYCIHRNNLCKIDLDWLVILGIICVIIIGLRHYDIGIDTSGYYDNYKTYSNTSFSSVLKDIDISNSEFGFAFINILFNKLSFSWNAFCIVLATLYIYPIFKLIQNKSANIYFSILMFLLCGSFFFSMSTIRQSVAIGLTIIAYLLYEKKIYWGLLFLPLAVTIHNSAIVAIIPYILMLLPLNKKSFWLWLIIAGGIIVFFKDFLQSVFMSALEASGREYNEVDTGGNLQELFFILTYILPYLISSNLDAFLKNNKFFIISLLLSLIFLPVFSINPAFNRLYFYFSIYLVVLIPNIFSSLPKYNTIRNIGELSYILAYLLTLGYYLNPNVHIIPYKFFWE